jgi:hypothetical protein
MEHIRLLDLSYSLPSLSRDAVDATMNYAAHVSFVNKCLAKYANEGKFQMTFNRHPTQLTSDCPTETTSSS